MKSNILIILFLFASLCSLGQTQFEQNKVRVIVNNASIIPTEGGDSPNTSFNQFLINYNITEIRQVMGFAKTPELRRLYELSSTYATDSLYSALLNLDAQEGLFLSVEKVPIPQNLSVNPADYWWQLLLDNDSTNDWAWYLKKIEADKAWNITKGDTNIVVAVIDDGVDPLHPDLIGKFSIDTNFYSGGNFNPQPHGTSVATLLAAETADSGSSANGQMPSIGYNTKIIFDSYWGDGVAKAVYASSILNAKVLSISWLYSCSSRTSWELAEKEILDNGTSIIRAAGNGNQHCNGNRVYPFSGEEDPRTIVVSGTGPLDNHVSTRVCAGGNTNSHYSQVDLCAPGYDLLAGTTSNNGQNAWPYACWGGTSQSTPLVSGTVALMHSVNSCLSSELTQHILKNTTDPIKDAIHFPNGVGAGRLNAYKAVKAAQGMYSSEIDLFIKDRPEDFGYPGSYAWGWWFDKSPDIWVRNQPDGFTNQEHQEPNYASGDTVYVYVRVWNKSCDSSNGVGNLSLYWTKASSSSSWPQNWDGSQPTVGNLVGTQSIPDIKRGESQIFEFKWYILNPFIHSNWASCLLARIEDIPTDSITVYPNHLEHDVYYNNNVALRNVTIIISSGKVAIPVIEGIERPHGRFMFVGNSTDDNAIFNITLEEPQSPFYGNLTEQAEVRLFTDDEGWGYLGSVVEQHPDLEVVGDKEFMVLSPSVTLTDIEFPANTRVPLYVGFSFLTDEQTSTEEYYYRISQQFSNTEDHITGAEHFVVRKTPRTPFDANAGYDQQIQNGDSTIVNADDISEPAIYNWYDPEGNLIYSGKDASVTPAITTTYKLEVIANTDGFKDYDEVTIKVQNHWIESISPNPASSNATIDYHLEQASSAYLMVINSFGTVSNNYILSVPSSQSTIDFSNYTPGVYNIVLIVNGKACDSKSLVIQ